MVANYWSNDGMVTIYRYGLTWIQFLGRAKIAARSQVAATTITTNAIITTITTVTITIVTPGSNSWAAQVLQREARWQQPPSLPGTLCTPACNHKLR